MWRTAQAGDVIVAKTDPPLLSVPMSLIAKLKGAYLVNWLQDIFPEVAEALNVGGGLGRLTTAVLRPFAIGRCGQPRSTSWLERGWPRI